MAAKSHRAGLSRIHPTLCAPSPLHLCSTFVSIASVQGTEAVDVSILHPCSACVGHTTLSAAEMSVAEHSPCLGGGKGKPSRTLWDYLISSWPVKSRDFQAGLLGEVGQGKKQRTRAMEERGVEAVLLQSSCGRVMPPKLAGDRSEGAHDAHRAPSSGAATCASPGPDREHCSNEARYRATAAAHRARGSGCRRAQLHQEGSRGTEILKRSWIFPLSLSQ